MSRMRSFIEWEWKGERWNFGERIDISRYGKYRVTETEFITFDSYPIILPVNVPGWIQLEINNTLVFGHDSEYDGIPTEFLHGLRGDKEENKYFGTPFNVLPCQYYDWTFKFGGEVIEEICEGDEKEYRILFADENSYLIKRNIKSLIDIKRFKILIPLMRYNGIDAMLCNKLLERGDIINNENLDKININDNY